MDTCGEIGHFLETDNKIIKKIIYKMILVISWNQTIILKIFQKKVWRKAKKSLNGKNLEIAMMQNNMI